METSQFRKQKKTNIICKQQLKKSRQSFYHCQWGKKILEHYIIAKLVN